MANQIEIDSKETPKIFVQTEQGEIFLHVTSSGEIRLSVEGKLVLMPSGQNSVNIEVRK